MVDSDRDAVLSSMLEELPRLRDDTFWPSFPEWMEELKLLLGRVLWLSGII
jgi:hypothetical protein